MAAARSAYYQQNRHQERESNRSWRKRNPEKMNAYAKGRSGYVRDWQAMRKAERTGLVAMFVPSEVRADYGNRCWACGSSGRTTMDHIVPLSRGGSNYSFNVRLLCDSCNKRKNVMLDHEVHDPEFRMALLLGFESLRGAA